MVKNNSPTVKPASGSAKPVRYAFWTSGWDSTYMVIKLLREGYTVQPLYVYNPKRKSREYEVAALDKLSKLIPQYVKSGKLLPYQQYSYNDIKIDPVIKRARKQICRQGWFVGTQYIYLASFAKQHHADFPIIALGLEKTIDDKPSGATGAIEKFGRLTKDLRVDPEHSSAEIRTVFGDFIFPIIETTEVQMLADVKKWGYEDLMKHIWFCHDPIRQQPCGFCSPCFQKMASKMEFLLPEAAQAKYHKFYHIQTKFGKPVKKIASFFYRLFHR